MRAPFFLGLLTLPAVLTLNAAPAAADLAGVELRLLASGLSDPVAIAQAGDDRLFIVEQRGRIRIFTGGAVQPGSFLDLSARVRSGGEQGLLGLAFHPRYAENGLLFVNYTREGDGATVISRFRRSSGDPAHADPASEAVLLVIPQPYDNHNGGDLAFGPEGFLYVGMGDGGSGGDPECRSQNRNELLGKMLRLDVDNRTAARALPHRQYVRWQGPALTRRALGLLSTAILVRPHHRRLFLGMSVRAPRRDRLCRSATAAGELRLEDHGRGACYSRTCGLDPVCGRRLTCRSRTSSPTATARSSVAVTAATAAGLEGRYLFKLLLRPHLGTNGAGPAGAARSSVLAAEPGVRGDTMGEIVLATRGERATPSSARTWLRAGPGASA
jgi:hypothetical protein